MYFELSNDELVADPPGLYCIQSEVTEYAKSVGVPLANVQCAGYMQNHIHTLGPKKVRLRSGALWGKGRAEAITDE